MCHKSALTLLLASILQWHVVNTASGQGTIDFKNLNTAGINAPVYESDGVAKLSGPQFMAELLAGPNEGNLVSIAITGFLTGNYAGYFNGGTQTLGFAPGGATVSVQVDVWNTTSGATFSEARSSGLPDWSWSSPVFSVVTGRPGGVNPSPPAPLTGLGNSPVYLNSVPEPSTLALGGLGAALTLFGVRQRRGMGAE